MYFSSNLNELLAKNRMRIADLARELKISPQQAGKYANGQSQPKMEGLVQLGKLFDIAIDDLILTDLSKGEGKKFGEGGADAGNDVDEQTKELNKLLRLRVAELERNIKGLDPGRAAELGIE